MEQLADWSTRTARDVGERIRRARNQQKMSAQALADRCGQLGLPLDRSVIAKLEKGLRQGVSLAEVLVIASALEVPPLALMLPVGANVEVEVLPGRTVPTWDAVEWIEGRRPLPAADDQHDHDEFDVDPGDDVDDELGKHDGGDTRRDPQGAGARWAAGAAPVQLWRQHTELVQRWRTAVATAARLRDQAAERWQIVARFRATADDETFSDSHRRTARRRATAVEVQAQAQLRQAVTREQQALGIEDELQDVRGQMRLRQITVPPLAGTGLSALETSALSPTEQVLARVLAERLRHTEQHHDGGQAQP
ncbi:helix-turn-helix transcriptional regulator [Streptosporangium sp. NPDC051022]|uniref:helix-turn-helix domain-containing protein n=1 Tax=Streptosporangium sp. NPDC051022 TaxID=3155752 RepID=UPI00341E3D72